VRIVRRIKSDAERMIEPAGEPLNLGCLAIWPHPSQNENNSTARIGDK
jgi:hypothetical protein